ncbi:MAG: RNA methyltransferase [Chloroflexota bacterium]
MSFRNAPTEGHFGIGIYQSKRSLNLGMLWRGAYQLGASYIFTVGHRYKPQPSDIYKTWLQIPLFAYLDMNEMKASAPRNSQLIGIEMGGESLPTFTHPPWATYLLGAEDSGLPNRVLDACHHVVSIPSVRAESYNVAQAGTIVMYDRMIKLSRGEVGGEHQP